MNPLRSFRTPAIWLRALLLALTLGFALNSIAHAGHAHDATQTQTHHQLACGHCVHLNALAGTPSHHVVVTVHGLSYSVPTLCDAAILSCEPALAAHPRGPPII